MKKILSCMTLIFGGQVWKLIDRFKTFAGNCKIENVPNEKKSINWAGFWALISSWIPYGEERKICGDGAQSKLLLSHSHIIYFVRSLKLLNRRGGADCMWEWRARQYWEKYIFFKVAEEIVSVNGAYITIQCSLPTLSLRRCRTCASRAEDTEH